MYCKVRQRQLSRRRFGAIWTIATTNFPFV